MTYKVKPKDMWRIEEGNMKVKGLDHNIRHLSNRMPGRENREMGSIEEVIREKRLKVKTVCYWLYLIDDI